MLLRPLFSLASGSGKVARLSVLIFHRVLPKPDVLFPDEMDARRFDETCAWIASWFKVLPLDDALERMRAGTLPARAACITFDDGYADNHDIALPILHRHGLSATFFIATGFIDGGRMWNDTIIESVRTTPLATLDLSSIGIGSHAVQSIAQKQVAIPALIGAIKYRPVQERVSITEQIALLAQVLPPGDLMMTSAQVKAMRNAGMQIGAHTVSHPILARLGDEEARHEIQHSKLVLENLLGERVGLFAYPNGKPGEDYNAQTVELVRGLGFDAAVSTHWGASRNGDDMFQIRRFTPWDRSRLRFAARMAANLRTAT